MALRVQPVPNPAVGHDWKYTIPGQYVMNVVAVQATLNTPPNITQSLDSSGHAHTLTISDAGGRLTWAATGPYAGGATDFALQGSQVTGSGTAQAFCGASAGLCTNPQTIEALVNLETTTTLGVSPIAQRASGATIQAALQFVANANNPADLQGVFNNVGFTLAAGMLPRAAWHNVCAVADGVNWLVYLDGVLVNTVAAHQPPNVGTAQFLVATTSAAFQGRIAAVAVYPSVLSAAQILAHVAAETTHDTYKAACLADSPAALWMLDTTGAMGSRLANLEVTDGTTTLADYPGGTITGVASSFAWTWASAAPGIAQTPNAQTNMVPIPALRLPPGYTLGTLTPDLQSTDQWTNVNVWWDDGELGTVGDQGPTTYYLNRMLVPDYGGR